MSRRVRADPVPAAGPRSADKNLRDCLSPHRATDQLLAGFPVEAHATLRGVHGLGNSEPVAPDVAAEGEGALPVDDGRRKRADVSEGVSDHMDRGVWNS